MKSQIILIIISGFVGAFAKEIVSWLLRKAPATARSLRRLINPFVLEIVFDLFLLGLAFRWLLSNMNGPPTVTRQDVFLIVISILFLLLCFYLLGRDLINKLEETLKKKNAEMQARIMEMRREDAERAALIGALSLEESHLLERLSGGEKDHETTTDNTRR